MHACNAHNGRRVVKKSSPGGSTWNLIGLVTALFAGSLSDSTLEVSTPRLARAINIVINTFLLTLTKQGQLTIRNSHGYTFSKYI